METCCGYGYGPARDSHTLPRIFKGRRKCTGHLKRRGALRDPCPYLRANRFQGVGSLTKKRELFPGLPPTSPCSLALPHWAPRLPSPRPGSGILTRFPFDSLGAQKLRATSPRFRRELSYHLGPTDPCSTAVHMEPFSTSVFKVLV